MASRKSATRSEFLRYTRDRTFFEASPQYVHCSTGSPVDVADLGTSGTTASIAGVATCFSAPVLTWQHPPESPWNAVKRVQIAPPLPDGSSNPAELGDRLNASVEALVGNHEAPAVVCWADAASAALLASVARACRHTGRRLTVLAPDVEDDLGRPLVPTVARLADAVAAEGVVAPVRLLVSGTKPAWTIDGPQIRAWPNLETSMVRAAEAHGADIVLDARGGARLLSATPYLASSAIRHGISDRLPSYLQDLGHSWIHEGLSATGRIKRWNRARAYWTLTWAGSFNNPAVNVLADHSRDAAEQWTNAFIGHALRHVLSHQATWAQAYLMHRTLPVLQRLSTDGSVRQVTPYCEPSFAEYAYGLPLLARYNPYRRTAYLRKNTLLADLVPQAQALLATFAPASYRNAAARSVRLIHRDPVRSVEVGLLRSDWRRHCRTEPTLATIAACEDWLAEAAQRGLL